MPEPSTPAAIRPWCVTLDDAVRVSAPTGADVTPRSRKARALIAYLACKTDGIATRSELIGLLWGDRGRDQARASLRQCLFELRTDIADLVEAEGESIRLTATVAFRPAVVQPLHDLDHIDPAFDGWLAAHRDAQATLSPLVNLRKSFGRAPLGLLAAVALAAVIAVAGLTAWSLRHRTAPQPAVRFVAILPWSVTPARADLRNLADRMVTSISAAMPTSRLAVHILETSNPARARSTDADWVISGEVLGDTRPVALTARIQSSAGVLLWSKRIEDTDSAALAADKLANWTGSVVACAAAGPRDVRRSDDVTALMMDACAKIYSGGGVRSDEDVLQAVRRWVAAAPLDAYAHGVLATSLTFILRGMPAGLQASAIAESEREAKLAISLDPTTGEAYLALGRLARDQRAFAQAENLFLRGLSMEPDHAALPNHLAEILATVGRSDEALVMARRSLARDPTSPVKIATVADLLARTGQPRAAIALIDEAEGRLGRDGPLACTKVFIAMRGDPVAARAAIAQAADAPGCLEPARQAELMDLAKAMERPQGPQAQALVERLAGKAEDEPGDAGRDLEALAALGRTDAALDFAQRHLIEPRVLFAPTTRRLLFSPRFPVVARRQRLWSYWEATGRWPDVCRDATLPWACGRPVKKSSASN